MVSKPIIEELERVLLTEEKFRMEREDVAMYSRIILSNADLVAPNFTLKVIEKDPADDRILECAVEGEVDYLISGNKHLLEVKEFQGIKIITDCNQLLQKFILLKL